MGFGILFCSSDASIMFYLSLLQIIRIKNYADLFFIGSLNFFIWYPGIFQVYNLEHYLFVKYTKIQI